MTTTPKQPGTDLSVILSPRDGVVSRELMQIGRLVAPEGASHEEMKAIAINRAQRFTLAVERDPKLRACSLDSLLQAMIDCATCDLWPGALKHMHLVPYGTVCQAIPGYQGLIYVMVGGRVTRVRGNVIRRGERYVYRETLSDTEFWHEPCVDIPSTDYVAAYAIAHLSTGPPQIEMVPGTEVEKIKRLKAASGSPAWKDYPEEMWKKTAIRRLWKRIGADNPRANRVVEMLDRPDPAPAMLAAPNEDPMAGVLAGARSYAQDTEELPT